jgi:Flp pilus assembly protein TadG
MNKRKGGALLEIAVALPFVLTLFIGLLDFTIFFYQQTMLQTVLHGAVHTVIENRASYSEPRNYDKLAAELTTATGWVDIRLTQDSGVLRLDASAPITPIFRPLTSMGYPAQTASRAFVRLH